MKSQPRPPFVEVNAVGPFNLGTTTIYSDFNPIGATPVGGGAACMLNITVDFCAMDTAKAADFFHMVHLTDVVNVELFLGGRNFTACAALGTSLSTTAMAGPKCYRCAFCWRCRQITRAECSARGCLMTPLQVLFAEAGSRLR